VVLFLGGIMGEQYTIAERMKQLRNITGFNRAEFARQQGIPLRTIEEWEAGRRKMPEYVLRLLAYKIQLESSKKDQRIHIIQDENNKSIVIEELWNRIQIIPVILTECIFHFHIVIFQFR
jgi:transcriptional regulator with XRE-family HTH domain